MNPSRLAIVAVLALLGCQSPEGPARRLPLRAGGSLAARDVVQRLLDHFGGRHPEVKITHLPSTHTGPALTALRAGQLDLVCVARDLSQDEAKGLTVVPLAKDPLVLVVRKEAGVTALTTDRVRALYRGEIRNWSRVGGSDLPVVLLDRPEHVGAKVALRAALLAGVAVDPKATVLDEPDAMDEALATHLGAIGYTSLRSALRLASSVRVVSVDGVAPSARTVRSGAYSISRTLSIAAPHEPSPAARLFLEHLGRSEVSDLLEAASLVPLRRQLRLAVPPTRNIVSLDVKWGSLARYLAAELGRPVELVHQPSYAQLVSSFWENSIDIAVLGSFAYAAAHSQSGVRVLARPRYGGTSDYRGVIYVRSDSPYRKLEDLRGRSIALSGRYTTAGHLFPEFALATRGLPPMDRFFSRARDAGSHEAALRALAEGRVEAAAAKDVVYEEMVREDPSLRTRTRALLSSPPVPGDGFGVGPLIGASLGERLQQILLTMHQTDGGRRVLRDLGADRFVETTDEDYRALYQMTRAVRKIFGAVP
jgi:phosphate/phosphite/phosphonate ABC transporter binding protein